MWQLDEKTSNWTALGVDDKIASKTMEGAVSSVKDTSQSAKKSFAVKVVGVNDKSCVKGVGRNSVNHQRHVTIIQKVVRKDSGGSQ